MQHDKRLNYVRYGVGKGALLKGHGDMRQYGGVEVSLQPVLGRLGYTLKWAVPEGDIPSEQHAVIMSLAHAVLQRFTDRQPICGVEAMILGGTWLGDATNNLYAEATELAFANAFRAARIPTEVRENG